MNTTEKELVMCITGNSTCALDTAMAKYREQKYAMFNFVPISCQSGLMDL